MAGIMWEKQFDNVWATNSPHLWRVKQGGKWGIYNSNDNTFPVPMVHDYVGDTYSSYLWRVEQGNRRGIYNSDEARMMLPPVFYYVDAGVEDIFNVAFTSDTSFNFNVKERLWEDPQAVISYCEENCRDMLPWAHLYTVTPEKVLQPH